MSLTPHEISVAAAQGWQLCEVYDPVKKKCSLEIMPIDFQRASQQQAMAAIVDRAKKGDALAVKALTVIARSNLYKRNK